MQARHLLFQEFSVFYVNVKKVSPLFLLAAQFLPLSGAVGGLCVRLVILDRNAGLSLHRPLPQRELYGFIPCVAIYKTESPFSGRNGNGKRSRADREYFSSLAGDGVNMHFIVVFQDKSIFFIKRLGDVKRAGFGFPGMFHYPVHDGVVFFLIDDLYCRVGFVAADEVEHSSAGGDVNSNGRRRDIDYTQSVAVIGICINTDLVVLFQNENFLFVKRGGKITRG